MIALRECPFCGNEHPDLLEPDAMDGCTNVFCAQCDCSGPRAFRSTKAAADAWNKRADDRYTITPLGAAMLEGKKNGG